MTNHNESFSDDPIVRVRYALGQKKAAVEFRQAVEAHRARERASTPATKPEQKAEQATTSEK